MSNDNAGSLHQQAAKDHEEAARHHRNAANSLGRQNKDKANTSAKSALDCSAVAQKNSESACAGSGK